MADLSDEYIGCLLIHRYLLEYEGRHHEPCVDEQDLD
jgi:hypothetical protein